MQVFNTYFKIIKKRLPTLLIYFIVFLVITLLLTNMMGTNSPATFSEAKTKIAFFNNDGDTPLTQGLKTYLGKSAQFVDIPDETEALQDALFYEEVSYVLRIPKGFTESFANGGNLQIEKTSVESTSSSVYVDFLLDKYLGLAAFYQKSLPDAALQTIADNTAKDLAQSCDVQMKSYGGTEKDKFLPYYFLFFAYCILAVMIMGVTAVMMSFNEKDLSRRNLCAPLPLSRVNFQLVLGNAVYALVVWALLMVFILAFSGAAINTASLLMMLNALIFTFVGLSIGFLAGKFIRNGGVQSAVANVVSLGISFISGVFVGQELLGDTVKTIASFTPGYWYVKAVNDIKSIVDFNAQTVMPVVWSMLIQIGFIAALLIIATAVSRQKQMNAA
jgi:ABC-2 type transport system permease protein